MARKITSGGRFAMVPEWLLDSDASALAIRLFSVLAAKHADRETNTCYPSRRLLAVELRLSKKNTQSVDKAIAELVEVGAITKTTRFDAAGDQASNLYQLHYEEGVGAKSHPPHHETSPRVAGDPALPVGAKSHHKRNQNQLNQNHGTRMPAAADRPRRRSPAQKADELRFERRARRNRQRAEREATEKLDTMSGKALAALEDTVADDLKLSHHDTILSDSEYRDALIKGMVNHIVERAKGRTVDHVIDEIERSEGGNDLW